ncbi:hypothetical protein [Sediminicola sp. 1XM1-17]|uniref:hypothetical protein n=1 Tax=Sediminicola sp. 1XM1-17 TaxID=3127702 RepID=UPI003076C03F
MKNIVVKNFTAVILLVVLLLSCSKGSEAEPTEKPIANVPGSISLTLPANGEPCTAFEEVAGEPLKVSVLFKWSSSEFAETYVLRVFESQTEVIMQSSNALESKLVLDKGKSYTWSVTAKNKEGEKASNSYSFTTPGEPVGNYVPYAAVITTSFNNNTSKLNISWVGRDEDGEPLTYDVTVMEEDTLVVEYAGLEITSIDPVAFEPKTIYTIEVVSKDPVGNFSVSKVTMVSPE